MTGNPKSMWMQPQGCGLCPARGRERWVPAACRSSTVRALVQCSGFHVHEFGTPPQLMHARSKGTLEVARSPSIRRCYCSYGRANSFVLAPVRSGARGKEAGGDRPEDPRIIMGAPGSPPQRISCFHGSAASMVEDQLLPISFSESVIQLADFYIHPFDADPPAFG